MEDSMKKIIDWVNFDADYPEVDEFSDEYDEYECDEVDQNAVDRAVEPGDSTSKTAIILSGESLTGRGGRGLAVWSGVPLIAT